MNGKTQSNDAAIRMTKMLESSDKNFKTAIIRMFQYTIINYLETNEKTKSHERNRL